MILKFQDYINESLNEGIDPEVKTGIQALLKGRKVFGRHVHPKLSGKEFEILSFSPSGAMAEVLWKGEKKPADMATMNINPKKIRIEE